MSWPSTSLRSKRNLSWTLALTQTSSPHRSLRWPRSKTTGDHLCTLALGGSSGSNSPRAASVREPRPSGFGNGYSAPLFSFLLFRPLSLLMLVFVPGRIALGNKPALHPRLLGRFPALT